MLHILCQSIYVLEGVSFREGPLGEVSFWGGILFWYWFHKTSRGFRFGRSCNSPRDFILGFIKPLGISSSEFRETSRVFSRRSPWEGFKLETLPGSGFKSKPPLHGGFRSETSLGDGFVNVVKIGKICKIPSKPNS